MDEQQIAEARKQLRELQDSINSQKKELSRLHQLKEQWFQKRAEIGGKIASSIRDVKEKRKLRDELTKRVHDAKKQRTSFSNQIKEKIRLVKDLRNKRKHSLDRLGIKGSPDAIKKAIKTLEFKLQTEPVSYEEERRLNRKLKELKAKYAKLSELDEQRKQIKTLSKEIEVLKKSSDQMHDTVQESAGGSQEYHETVVVSSKSIDELKSEEEGVYKKFSTLKDEYTEKKKALQADIDKAEVLRKQLGEEAQIIDKKKQREILKEKSKEVEEKVKKREKLTTEDLLAFQASD